jgi:uncharacterized iron-regulated membrane protein
LVLLETNGHLKRHQTTTAKQITNRHAEHPRQFPPHSGGGPPKKNEAKFCEPKSARLCDPAHIAEETDEEGDEALMPPTTGDVVFGITVNWWSVLALVAVIVVGFWLWRRRKRGAKVSGESRPQ